MKPANSHPCPFCGAFLEPQTNRCDHCSTAITPQPLSQPSAHPSIPPSFSDLKRPEPTPSLKQAGSLLLFGLYWTLVCLFFFIFSLVQYANELTEYARLKSHGRPALATITNLEIESGDESNTYYAYYQFKVEINGDETRFEGVDSISRKSYMALKTGQTVEIIYWIADPEISAIQSQLNFPVLIPTLLLCLIGPFTVIGIVLIHSSYKSLAQLRELRTQGLLANGWIYDRWEDKDSDGDRIYLIAYTFHATIPGKGLQIITHAEQDHRLYKRYRVGDAIIIRYLPTNPQVCEIKAP